MSRAYAGYGKSTETGTVLISEGLPRPFAYVSSWEVHWRNALRFPNQWARKHLRSGDLAVLFRISKREWVNAEPDQIERLMRRSFVKKEADDSLRPTATGPVALWIRRFSGI